ncbi:septum site-determining protein MinC [Oceanobacillus picturae]|uniref:Probable septum site-determining protein MinC n=1 Tax=Oceanobacillus picturae TaxID=171693 RepID=W9AGC9_9BACI|nr:septum site-determining protein MinC [Oceanobacillus picturae]RIU93674.1 septum site-determining protein MinC [Oceanobacillus picturae]GAQ16722.1 septum site-determining protein MinC [Oceanobacillus picturae]CDO01741.1 Septum site-determining protein MinC [Oceanobacillus picturae]
MLDKKQFITIKGTKEGLTLFVDDSCTFEHALNELREKIHASRPKHDEPVVSVKVKLGNRYVQEEQKEILRKIIAEDERFTIDSIVSDVVRRDEALQWQEASEVKTVNRIIRSGQVLEVTGDLLLIGDVNPGGKVVSTGNIYIMGRLNGIAHAGINGDKQAFITASYMKPSQLRIAEYISRAPDYESDGVYMECGLIDEEQDKIVIDRLQVLSHKSEISGFGRRMQNG